MTGCHAGVTLEEITGVAGSNPGAAIFNLRLHSAPWGVLLVVSSATLDFGPGRVLIELQFDDQSIISIPSRAPMKQWGVDIHAAVRVKDAYIDHTIEKKGELEQPNKLLRMYFKQDPRMRAAMRDGVFGLTCKGTFARPNCRPTPTTTGSCAIDAGSVAC